MTLNEQIISALKNNKLDFIQRLVEERNFDFSIYSYHFVEYASKHSNVDIWKYLLNNIDYLKNYEYYSMNLMKRNSPECLEFYLSKNVDLSFNNNALLKQSYIEQIDEVFYLLIKEDKILNLIKEEKEESEEMAIISPFKKEDHKENAQLCQNILNKAQVLKFKVF